jgi:hypothetical protein
MQSVFFLSEYTNYLLHRLNTEYEFCGTKMLIEYTSAFGKKTPLGLGQSQRARSFSLSCFVAFFHSL